MEKSHFTGSQIMAILKQTLFERNIVTESPNLPGTRFTLNKLFRIMSAERSLLPLSH